MGSVLVLGDCRYKGDWFKRHVGIADRAIFLDLLVGVFPVKTDMFHTHPKSWMPRHNNNNNNKKSSLHNHMRQFC